MRETLNRLVWVAGLPVLLAGLSSFVGGSSTQDKGVEVATIAVLIGTAAMVGVYAWWTRDLVVEAKRPHLAMWSTPARIWDGTEIVVNVANAGPGGVTRARLVAVRRGQAYYYEGPLALASGARERWVRMVPIDPSAMAPAADKPAIQSALRQRTDRLVYVIECMGLPPWGFFRETDSSFFEHAWMQEQKTEFGRPPVRVS